MMTKEEFLENINFKRYPKYELSDIHEGGNPSSYGTVAIVLTSSDRMYICRFSGGRWFRTLPTSTKSLIYDNTGLKEKVVYWVSSGKEGIFWRKNEAINTDCKPSCNHSVLIKSVNGGIAEGEWKGDGSWLQYRWSAKLEDSKVIAWAELEDIGKGSISSEAEVEDPGSSKFEIGSWVVQKSEDIVGQVEDIDFICRKKTGESNVRYHVRDLGSNAITCIDEADLKSWSIKEDAKDGDILSYPDGSVVIFKHLHSDADEGIFTAHVLYVDNHIELMNTCSIAEVHPAAKEECDFLFTKLKEAGYFWDPSRKELVSGNLSREDVVRYASVYSSEVWNKLMRTSKAISNYKIDCNDIRDMVSNAIINAYDNFTAITKFHKGDWCFHTEKKFAFCIAQVDLLNYHIITSPRGSKIEYSHKELESISSIWTIQDAREGDILGWDDSDVLVKFKKKIDDKAFESQGSLSHDIYYPGPDTFVIEGVHPATSEQWSEYIRKEKEAGYGNSK